MKWNKKRFYFLGLLFLCGSMAGCASMSAPPACPDSSGLQCARVDQINRRIDQGRLGVPVTTNSRHSSMVFAAVWPNDANPSHPFSMPDSTTAKKVQPLWNRATVIRIWVAPYEDSAGNYHEASRIDTRVKSGYWMGNLMKINTDSDSRS